MALSSEADDAWAHRVSARLAAYGVTTTHTPIGDPALDDIRWPNTPNTSALGVGGASTPRRRERADKANDSSAAIVEEVQEELFPSCFYAQMLSILPNVHRSVSADNTPRASVVGADGMFAGKDDQRLTSRIMKHTRDAKYGDRSGGDGGADAYAQALRDAEKPIYPTAIIDYCDGAILAKAHETHRELTDMLLWAQQRNQRSMELRRVLEHSKAMRELHGIPNNAGMGSPQ